MAPQNPPSVYIPMSATDSYTQSHTRLQTSVTELNAATAHWRRNVANAHLAAKALFVAGKGCFGFTIIGPKKCEGPRDFSIVWFLQPGFSRRLEWHLYN